MCLFFYMGTSIAQEKVREIEKTVRNVAENIINNTSFKVVNKKTGELFEDSRDLPLSRDYDVKSSYNEWRYWNGVMNIGFISLGNTLNESSYIDYAKKNVGFVFHHGEYFKKRYESGMGAGSMSQRFRLEMLDDCGAMGAGIAAVYKLAPQQQYLDYLNTAADYVMGKEYRLEDGTFCRKRPYEMTIWGDDLYMSVPFLSRMGELTGDRRYFDEAVRQVVNFHKYLWDEQKGIYYHCWYDDTKRQGSAYWGRCNGWIILAKVELLDKLPEDHPGRQAVVNLLNDQIAGVSRYQDTTGLWHQLLNVENTYLETSCSAMFSYAIAKAVNEGWTPNRYGIVAYLGWEGVSSKIRPDGQVEGICCGTCISTSPIYYATRETPLNDIHGLGAILLAGGEVIKLISSGDLESGCGRYIIK